MKNGLLALVLLLQITVYSQSTPTPTSDGMQVVTADIKKLQKQLKAHDTKLAILEAELNKSHNSIDSLKNVITISQAALAAAEHSLSGRIQSLDNLASSRFSSVDNKIANKTLVGTIILGALFLLSIAVFVVLRLRLKNEKLAIANQISLSSNTIMNQIQAVRSNVDDSLITELNRYADLIEKQLTNTLVQANRSEEPDHSLALKVASEINLIERNISMMDSKTKGLKQIQSSVTKLKDNLSANGYEMPELLGKQYHQGMKVNVISSIQDENLEKGSEVIKKVLIPQVNFRDKMIQTAQIEIAIGN